MNILITLILCALALTGCNGCGKIEGTVTHKYDKFFTQFNEDLIMAGIAPLDFSETITSEIELKDNKYARCGTDALKKKGLTVIYYTLPDKMPLGYSDWFFMLLTYHEIGHCFYNKPHTNKGHIMSDPIDMDLVGQMLTQQGRIDLIKDMISR